MIWEDFENRILEFVKSRMESDPVHGIDHVLRVVRLCLLIGKEEGADLDVLIPAAYLHDVARKDEEERGMDHAAEGARIAGGFLREIGYPRDKIAPIEYAIRVHRFRSEEEPRTLEAKILKDADMLDALGAIGIYRVVSFSCRSGRGIGETIEHLREKILRLPSLTSTEAAKRIAVERVRIVEEFVKRLEKEAAPHTGEPSGV